MFDDRLPFLATAPSVKFGNIRTMNDTHGTRTMLTPAEAADQLRVSRGTIYRWCRQGWIPNVQVGGAVRIPTRLLVDLLARSSRGARL